MTPTEALKKLVEEAESEATQPWTGWLNKQAARVKVLAEALGGIFPVLGSSASGGQPSIAAAKIGESE